MDFSAYDSSMEREYDDSDVSVMIKQLCAKSDVISRFVVRLSGMIDQLQHEAKCCMELVRSPMKYDQTLNDVWEFETKAMNLETDFYGAANTSGENESESNSGVEANDSDESDNGDETNAINDSSPVGTANTSLEAIDEAGSVSLRLTLEESTNMETDRTTLQNTLAGMYDLDGIDINEDTLEELETSHTKTKDIVNDQVIIDKMNCYADVAKDPNSVDSKGSNCHDCKARVHINKQNLDIADDVADDVRVGKDDVDDVSVVPQRQISVVQTVQEISQLQCIDKVIGDLVVQVPRMQVVEKTVDIPQLQTVEKTAEAETSNFQQFEGTPQAREKQLENDVTGRVSESCKHFQLGAQFRDTADEHGNTHEHSMHSTYTEHQCRDNTSVTMTTDERSNDDNEKEGKQGEQGQGGSKA